MGGGLATVTAFKQVAICSSSHMRSLAGYLDRESAKHDVLDFDSQHLSRPDRWADEFARTRAAYGHDRAGKAGARNTVCYHQVLGFNPDECDLNGGRLTRSDCMAYAREWVERHYPNQEAAWALHLEKAPDGTGRYAVHIAINRTDLSTGRRLDEGRASRQKSLHARRVREMDAEHGLSQLKRGVRNSATHARQPSRGEQRARMAGAAKHAGFESDLDRVRRSVRESVREVAKTGSGNKMRELATSLRAKGIEVHMSSDKAHPRKELVFTYTPSCCRSSADVRPERRKVSGPRLGRGYSLSTIGARIGLSAAREMNRTAEAAMGDEREM